MYLATANHPNERIDKISCPMCGSMNGLIDHEPSGVDKIAERERIEKDIKNEDV